MPKSRKHQHTGKPGRPPLADRTEVRERHLDTRWTDAELQTLETAAEQAGCKPAVYVREHALRAARRDLRAATKPRPAPAKPRPVSRLLE